MQTAPSLEWSTWTSLDDCLTRPVLPSTPGLYRLRQARHRKLVYIGQTGVSLRARVRHLQGIHATIMPYSDPHTAGPALWALFQETQIPYEVSVCPVGGDAQWRKGLECVAIAQYRQERGESPRFNFGRMPAGYTKSSGNTARLVRLGKRFRGRRTNEVTHSHRSSIAPVGGLDGSPQGAHWCGHAWSDRRGRPSSLGSPSTRDAFSVQSLDDLEWFVNEDESLRIVPQKLWDGARKRLESVRSVWPV